ncbi:MAG TPA: hypothetical protein V6D20_13490, partial [Candidatus Obscuribacterales bacterium]
GFRCTSTQYLEWTPGINLQTDSFSLAFTYQEYLTFTRGVFGIEDANDSVEIGMSASGPVLRVSATTGTTVVDTGTAFDLQQTQRFVLIFDNATDLCTLYQDGVQTAQVDFSGLTFLNTSAYTWRLNDAPSYSGGFGSFTGYLEWDRALSPAEVAEVWATPEIGTYPALTTKYVASDVVGSTIPDSSGNANASALLEGLSTPSLAGNKLEFDKAQDHYLRMEAGIASQVGASGAFTLAVAFYGDDPDAVWAVNTSAGANLNLMLYSSAGMAYYGPSLITINTRNHDRAPGVLVISYDSATQEAIITLNGVLIYNAQNTGTIPVLSASDLWSINNEYDAASPSNIGTIDFYEVDLWDSALDAGQCINVSRDLFNTYFRA